MSLVDTIYNRLRLDPTLTGTLAAGQYTGILKGGVWKRPLKREGATQTPEAFYQAEIGKLNRVSAVVLDGGITPHRQVEAIPHSYTSFPRVVLYAPAGNNGKSSLENAFARIYTLLHNYRWEESPGIMAELIFADRTPTLDSEEFIGAISSTARFQVRSRLTTGE